MAQVTVDSGGTGMVEPSPKIAATPEIVFNGMDTHSPGCSVPYLMAVLGGVPGVCVWMVIGSPKVSLWMCRMSGVSKGMGWVIPADPHR